MSEPVRDLMHYLGIEEENVLKNITNLGEEFLLIPNLDILYRTCFDLQPINKPELKIPAFLFLNAHIEFLLGMASFLRLHQSKTFLSLRIALDCSFTSYYLLKHPDKREVYLSPIFEKDDSKLINEWNKIFRNIKRTIEKDIDNFPEAKDLPKIHDFCSKYAHADALGIMPRYNEDKKKLILEAQYFDYEPTPEDEKKWLGALLFGFFRIFLVFWNEMFKQRAGDKLKEIENRIVQYQKRLSLFRERYPLRG